MEGFEVWRPSAGILQLPENTALPATVRTLPPHPLSKGSKGRYMHRGHQIEFPLEEKRYTMDDVMILSIPNEETFEYLENRKNF